MGGSREEIAEEARRTDLAYQRARKQVYELTELASVCTVYLGYQRMEYPCLTITAQIFKKTYLFRRARWRLFRAYIASRAKAQFTYLLSERSFRGRLLTDHDAKLLDLQVSVRFPFSLVVLMVLAQVEPDITKDNSSGRGAKTLSGGEKSFSQVCLLLSLWEAMGAPIRCLDELYVFYSTWMEDSKSRLLIFIPMQ